MLNIFAIEPMLTNTRAFKFFKNILFYLFFLFIAKGSIGQTTRIRGFVQDAETKEPLPFVNISFKGTNIGTITDFEGWFFLETRHSGDSITISYVGYLSQTIQIRKFAYQEINIELIPESVMLDAVVIVPSENPAHRIIRNIISSKGRNNPDNIHSYVSEVYNKLQIDVNNVDESMKEKRLLKQFHFVFDHIDTNAITGKAFLPIFISEAVSDYYFQRSPKVEHEVIKVSQISGFENESVSQFTGKFYQNVNIYDNYINVFDQGLVSPIASSGFFYYKYYLVDSAFIQNRWCYQISFKPKRRQEPTFTGDFWVNDTTWSIVKAQVRLSAGVNLNFVNDLVANIDYEPITDSIWFPVITKIFADFNLSNRTTGFFGTKTTVHRNIKINELIPERIAQSNERVAITENALNSDSTLWRQLRPFELSPKEAGIYALVDTVKQVPMFKTFLDLYEIFVNYYYIIGYFEIGPYYKTFSFNEIEGNRFRLSGRTSNKFSTKFMLSAFVAYGDKDERFKWGIEGLYMFDKMPRQSLMLSYSKDIEQLGQSPNALVEDNILTSILRRNPNYKLTLVNDIRMEYHKEWFTGFSNTISLANREIFPTEHIPFTSPDQSKNFEKLTTTSASLNTRWIKNERFVTGEFERVSLGSTHPEINLTLTGSLKGLASDFSFLKVNFNYYHKTNINPLGYLRYIIDAGKIFGTVPYPLLQLHEGNETYAFDRYAFNMMNYYEFASDQYVSLYLEHHFQGFFLNRIPIMRKLKWREVVAAKGLIGSIRNENRNIYEFPIGLYSVSDPYLEVSVGVENIFKVVRFDALWRLTHLDHPNIERFGLRMGFQIIF